MPAKIRYAVSAAVAVLALVPAGATGASGAARPIDRSPRHLMPMLDAAGDTDAGLTDCGVPAPDPVPDGQPIVVTIPPGPTFTVGQIPASWWAKPPYGDAGWQLHVRGFMWLAPLARRAALDGQTASLDALVQQVAAFHTQSPDKGTSDAGWDEGTALRRLGAENCLYSLTRDARLLPGMRADVAVQYGPRFYGPPINPVHNHGIMADLAVLRAADLLARTDWRDRSVARLVAEAPQPWTPAGTSKEQSASYHAFNVVLWRQVAAALESRLGAGDPNAARIRVLVARAAAVTYWLTEPDGRLVVLGDSLADPGTTAPAGWSARVFRDDVAGLVVGRWSWTDPTTSYYTIRYGPRRWAHGQEERAGITWTTAGRRVLVGPGKALYDPAGAYRAWGRGPYSHNVVGVDKRAFSTKAGVTLSASTVRGATHTWATTDALFGVRHLRQYTVYRDTRTLTVKDTVDGRAAFHQYWHLDPSWQLGSVSRDGKRVTLRSGDRSLTVTTTGVAAVVRGKTRPISGWNFPTDQTRISAVEIQVRGTGTASTTFVVR